MTRVAHYKECQGLDAEVLARHVTGEPPQGPAGRGPRATKPVYVDIVVYNV